MKFLLRSSVVLGLLAHGLALNSRPVGTVFNVNLNNNNNGGCGYAAGVLPNIVNDIYGLAQVGIQLVLDYNANVPEARRLMDSFFQVGTPPMSLQQMITIGNNFAGIASFLSSGGFYNGGSRSGQPYLFCDSSWLQKKTMNSPAQDSSGQTYPNIYTGQEMLIGQEQQYIDAQKTESAGLRAQAVPYWSATHNAYIFDRNYPGGINNGYCSVAGYEAATQHVLNPSTVTLCAASFGDNPPNYRGRMPVAANPVPVANIPRGNNANFQRLEDVQPTAITLFHELFHLVYGNDNTYPNVGEVYGVLTRKNNRRIVGLNYVNAVVNPESYAMAAVAYDYTLNAPANGGNPIEFYTGYCTAG